MALCALALLILAADVPAAAIWRRTTDGLWSDTNNWSTPSAPTLATGSTYITNAMSKVVLLDAATPSSNLWVTGLNVWAPANATNTLRLADLGDGRALVVSNATLSLTTRGAIEVTNASLVVTGRFLSFNMWGGTLTLDGGSIVAREEPLTTNVTVITRIGRTNEAVITINQGTMEVSQLLVGESPGAQFRRSRGLIRLNGGSLNVRAELSLGDDIGCTGIVQIAGGTLNVANNLTNIMRVGDFGQGLLTVANGAANIGNLSVGRHDGAQGTVLLLDGGALNASDDLSVGRFSGATGLVFVAGGMLRVTNNSLWVGREGVGELVVSNGQVMADNLNVAIVPTNTVRGAVTLAGGTTLLASNLTLGSGGLSTGQVLVAGGELIVSNASRTAHVSLLGGTLTLSGGSMTSDTLDLTNTAARIEFRGGTLRSGGTRVANGQPFVVGDGVHSATFELLGGVHEFPDGLIVSSNATLTGCGAILGSIVNHGTIATNTGCPLQVPPRVLAAGWSNQTFTLSFESLAGLSYVLEFKDSLDAPLWTSLGATPGTGGWMSLVDPSATVPIRFYRVRAE